MFRIDITIPAAHSTSSSPPQLFVCNYLSVVYCTVIRNIMFVLYYICFLHNNDIYLFIWLLFVYILSHIISACVQSIQHFTYIFLIQRNIS